MRCISPHAKYSIQVIEAEEQIVVDARGMAMSHVLKKPVIANFDKTGLLDYEQEAALMAFDFSGLPDGVNPLTRIAVFDSEFYVEANFPPDKRDSMLVQIDARLRELEEKNPGQYIIVDPPQAEKPWPRYNDYDVEKILAFQEALGVPPEKIRLYELENDNRPEVIDAMLRLEDPQYAAQREEEEKEAAYASSGGGGFDVQA